MVLPRWLFALLCLLGAGGGVRLTARANGEEVVVLYVKNSAESRSVAEYYAARRGVPADKLIALDLPMIDNLTRADFSKLVEVPLIGELQSRKLCRFETTAVPATNDFPARTLYRCVESRVRYLMPTWGFPFRILEDP